MVNFDILKKLIQVLKREKIGGISIEKEGTKYEVWTEKGKAVSQKSSGGKTTKEKDLSSEARSAEEEEEEGVVAITSPMVGTFYRAPSPDSPPFVENGDEVEPGKAVCIIEAMKLFNEIEAEISGKIVKILVENAKPVEYGQKLMLVKKS